MAISASTTMSSTGLDYSDSFEVDEEIESISLGSSFESSTAAAQMISESRKHKRESNGRREDKKTPIFSPPILKNISSNGLQVRSATGGSNGRTARFRAAAQKVQTMQSVVSAARRFSSSLEVRDAVFSDWMSRKQASMSREKSEMAKAKKEKEEIKRRKEEKLAERTVKVVDEWNTAKTVELLKKQKQQKEEARVLQLKAKEKEERQSSSELASEKWRVEKTKVLVSQRREKKMKVREEEDKKTEDAAEKAQSADQAFKAWSHRKDGIVKDQRRKQKQEKEELGLKKQEEAYLKQEESHKAFQAWKGKKDEKIKKAGKLYTYDEKGTLQAQPWCPARSMKYGYPEKARTSRSRSEKSSTVRSVSLSASTASSVRSEGSCTSLSSAGSSRVTSPEPGSCKGKLKTIQVCCQTLEYWCTCGNQ